MSALTAHSNTVAAQVTDAAFVAEAGRIRDLVGDQIVLSQGRCVDHLLDLMNLTTEPSVQAELVDCLSGIRKLSAVEGDVFRAALAAAVAAVEVEAAYAQFVLR
ncbi:MAG: hypothetical protein GEV08_02450 [Acidimicrobiia bacterium]|nr:hypothetical protein [Acidimicrobiia bacterium]